MSVMFNPLKLFRSAPPKREAESVPLLKSLEALIEVLDGLIKQLTQEAQRMSRSFFCRPSSVSLKEEKVKLLQAFLDKAKAVEQVNYPLANFTSVDIECGAQKQRQFSSLKDVFRVCHEDADSQSANSIQTTLCKGFFSRTARALAPYGLTSSVRVH